MINIAEPHLTESVKKNLLDLHFSKYLLYQTTVIVIIFTYIVGLSLAFIGKQIKANDLSQVIAVVVVSIVLLSPLIILLLNYRTHMRNILEEIRKLHPKNNN